MERMVELESLRELAAHTERRAVQARGHAAQAREHALRDAAQGDHEAEQIHRREAQAHDRAAKVTEQTAALYRRRIGYLALRAADPALVANDDPRDTSRRNGHVTGDLPVPGSV
jgi:hypothetical protein